MSDWASLLWLMVKLGLLLLLSMNALDVIAVAYQRF